ncbi:MAG: hypothetical protein JWM60_2652 [Solirubrobacterales bacterium]|nr:hypothetical protein [Solirubrobacterales bacterium]
MGDAGRTARPLLGRRLAEVERALGAEEGEAARCARAVANAVSPQRVVQLARELDLPVAEGTLTGMTRVSLALTIGARTREPRSEGERHERAVLTLSLREPLLAGSDLPSGAGALRLTPAGASGGWRLSASADADPGAGHVAHPLVGAGAVGLLASRELVLPRQWSDEVGELALDEQGVHAWGRLRERLAAEQERELFGESDGVVSHRWLGLPDDRSGSMPLECELRARGLFEHGVAPYAHERDGEVDSECSRWRMLLQLSADPRIGWRWGERGERLYVWMTREDMREGRFDGAQVVLR